MNQDPIVRINTETCIFSDNRLHVYYSVYIGFEKSEFRQTARFEAEAQQIAAAELENRGYNNFPIPDTQGKWKLS